MPTLGVLVIEHLLMRHVYHRPSSLQRLSRKLGASGRMDLLFTAIQWIPFGLFKTALKFLTLPGLCFLALLWLHNRMPFNGLFAFIEIQSTVLNLVLWYLVFDLGHYLAHRLLHQVPFLWKMHRFHHSASEMNILTGVRVSFAEQAFTQLISFGLISLCFGIPKPELAVALILTRRVMELVQHSDLPWDYGIVGKVLVGPRFHRMHHSRDPRDYNANYGNLFTIWDFMFRTRAKRYFEQGSTVADRVEIGLESDSEMHKMNRWWFALFHQTFFEYAWLCWRNRVSSPKPTKHL